MIKNILSGNGMMPSPMMQGQMPQMPMMPQQQMPMLDPFGQQINGLRAALMGGMNGLR